MSTQNKQRNQRMVLELAAQPGNNICADCKAKAPQWASYNLGIFICLNCASIHRKIGTHITRVKSLRTDEWTKEQVENMKFIGNIKSNRIYNPNEIRYPPPPNLENTERDSEIEQYIREKYQYKRFLDKSAVVASMLGPSQSSSLAQVPPASLPGSNPHTTKPHVAAPPASNSSYTAPAAPSNPSQMLPTAQQQRQPSGDVWDDMDLLKGNNQNSSLPLQYQQTTYPQSSHSIQPPAVNGAIGANNYFVNGTPSVIGLNPYQTNQVRENPFAQQQIRPTYTPSSLTSTFSTTQTINSQPFGQQSVGVPQSSGPLPVSPPYYNPQQPTSIVQNPGFNSEPPSQVFPPAPPVVQPHFSPHNHNSMPHYVSHSSHQMQSSSIPPYINIPQQMQSSSIPQGMYPPGPAQMGGHNVSSHSQFLGMTTMQMQQHQQQMQMQQQQQQQQMQQQHQAQLGPNYHPSMQPQTHMMSHQVNSAYSQTSAYPQGGFPPQTGSGQW